MLAAAATLPLLPGHEGLPCPLRTITGVPCPLCGMTTSVEDTLRLDLHGAAAAKPVGIVAVLVAIALLALRPATMRVSLLPILLALAAMWIFELHRFSIL